MAAISQRYPARLAIDYPDRDLNRTSTFFRIFAAIPIVILLSLIGRSGSFGGLLFLPVVLMLLFRRKYPRWWFTWNLELTRFGTRVGAYALLLDDAYPSTDEEQSVHLEIDPPDAPNLSRGMPLIKWLMALPHYVVLAFLFVGVLAVAVVAWFAILFTGRYPRWAFDYIVGVLRWSLRVQAYAFILTTDEYPPFSLQ